MATFEANSSQASYKLKLNVWEKSVDNDNNKSVVAWNLKLSSGEYNFYGYSVYVCVDIAGTRVFDSSPQLSIGKNDEITIAQGEMDIYHNNDGTKNIGCYAKIENGSSYFMPGIAEVNGDLNLTNIARKPVVNIKSVDSITLNTARVNYEVISGAFWGLEYRLNNGEWKSTRGHPYTVINNLEPNTSYKIELRGFNEGRTLVGDASNSKTIKTLDICRMNEIGDLELGEDLEVSYNTITNVVNKIGILDTNSNILIDYRECSNGKYTFSLTEEEKELLYKKFTNNITSYKVYIALKSIQNNKEYIDKKEIDVLLTGDVCSASIFIDGANKKCKVWVGTATGNKQGIFTVGTSKRNVRGK